MNYLDFDLKTKRGREIHDSIVDYLPLVFCNEDGKGWDELWERGKRRKLEAESSEGIK